MTKQYKADLALIVITAGWGLSYIFMKNIMIVLETFNLLGIRFLLSALGMGIIFHKRLRKLDKITLKGGILIGIFLFSAYAVQTLGLKYTTVSKSSFITGFSTVIVPIFSAIIFKKIPRSSTISGVILAFIGLALLTLNGDLELNIGDLYTLIGAFCFAFHILAISKYATRVDSINVTILQIGVVGFLSLIFSFLFETPRLPSEPQVWISLSFLILVCTIAGFITQNVAQKYTSAIHASLILASEPFFASIFAYFIIGEILPPKGMLGGLLIVLGILVAELNLKFNIFKSKKKCSLNNINKQNILSDHNRP
jgi:drug/metabolite transporter (DMT)-like permease